MINRIIFIFALFLLTGCSEIPKDCSEDIKFTDTQLLYYKHSSIECKGHSKHLEFLEFKYNDHDMVFFGDKDRWYSCFHNPDCGICNKE